MIRPLLKLRVLSLIAFSTLSLLQAPVRAELTIEITGAGANRIPVAIADFGGEYWNGIYPMGAYPQPPRPTAVVTSAFKLSAMPSLAQTGS